MKPSQQIEVTLPDSCSAEEAQLIIDRHTVAQLEVATFVCAVCNHEPTWSWTDTHGVAQCWTCGTPYRIYHYENDKRVNKPPEILVHVEYIPLCRRYFTETGRRASSGMSFPGGQELATHDEAIAFSAWMKAHAPATTDKELGHP